MTWCTEDLTTLAQAAGAEIRTQVEATEEIIAAYDPYAVICAIAAAPCTQRLSAAKMCAR